MKKLSICCLGYNHAAFLQENFDAVARLNYPQLEVIVVDDGSTDGSAVLITQIKDRYPFPIRLIAQENTGNIGKNFNTALHAAQGDIITFIALDDVFNPVTLGKAVAEMNRRPELAFTAACTAQAIDSVGFLLDTLPALPTQGRKKADLTQLLDFEYRHFGSFYLQGTLIRKEILTAVGGFDEDMTGDDIILRTKIFRYLQQQPQWDYALLQENTVFYRLHDGNVHKNSVRQLKIVGEYLQRYWPDAPAPDIFGDWLGRLLQTRPLTELNAAAADSPLLQQYLAREDVRSMCRRHSRKARRRSIRHFFYHRRRHGDGRSTITLLRLISFTCGKQKQKTTDRRHYHYLELTTEKERSAEG